MGSSSLQPRETVGPIAIDAMGGDRGPAEVVAACKLALQEGLICKELILVGDEAVLTPLLKEEGLEDHPQLRVYHASQVIGMEEKPIQSLRQKKDASMVRALELVKADQAEAVLSCGNTGSLMAGGTLKLRPMSGLERPALATVIPSRDHRFILLDVGANPDSSPEHLVHNAILGSCYCEIALGIKRPRVGLLTIGTEEFKGTDRIQKTHDLLKSLEGIIHYEGLIEGFQLFNNEIDVVVCDGFTGNVLIKSWESLILNMGAYIKDNLKQSIWGKLGALLASGAARKLKKELSPEGYGGAPLLGLQGTVLKAHGSSNRHSLKSAIRMAQDMVQQNMVKHIEESLTEASQRLEAAQEGTPCKQNAFS